MQCIAIIISNNVIMYIIMSLTILPIKTDVNIDIILGSSVGLAFIVITVTVVMIGLVIIVVTKRGILYYY